MLARFRQLMDFELSIAELIGIGVLLAGPYLHHRSGLVEHPRRSLFMRIRGVELLVSVIGSIVLWPALLLANVCLT